MIRTFEDDDLGLVVNFPDGKGSVNDRSQLVSRFLVVLMVYVEVNLIIGVDLLVDSVDTFVKDALVAYLRGL